MGARIDGVLVAVGFICLILFIAGMAYYAGQLDAASEVCPR